MSNPQKTNFDSKAFDLAVSFYKLFDIDPYKWAALCTKQVDLIENALKEAYGQGVTAGLGEFNDQ